MIRPAKLTDLPAIANMYNYAILNTTATFYTEPQPKEYFEKWFHAHNEQHPIWVYDIDNECVGYVSLSEWSDKCAYDGTQELSVYVAKAHHNKGIGKQLMQAMIDHGKELGVVTIVSRIAQESDASLHLHKKLGFEVIGNMRKVGFKFGKFLDVLMMQYVY